jgi:hypothetical protein
MTTVLEHLYCSRLIITLINIDSERQLVNVFMVQSIGQILREKQHSKLIISIRLSDKFIYSIIKYSYFIGLCRYKILNIVILLIYVDTNHATP